MNKKSSTKRNYRENENLYSKHVAEILWSRDNLDLPERLNFTPDFAPNFSRTEGSLSSSSWGFDDFELRSVKKITSSLDAIEEALYEDNKNSILNDELQEECRKWSNAFPHLRLKGEQLLPSDYSGTIFAIGQSFDKSLTEESPTHERNGENVLNIAYIKEKIVERLALQVWTEFINNLKERQKVSSPDGKQTASLPPIYNESFSPPRTKSITTLLQASDFPKLEGILTISPKILLSRSEERCLRRGMTETSRSLLSALSASSLSHQNLSPDSPLPLTPVRRPNGKILDRPFCFPPAKDEDFSYKCLQGLHIEPEKKDVKMRYFPHEQTLILNKPPSFLPPINDKTHSFHPLADLNRPISYESRIASSKSVNPPNIYTRHLNKMSSRPSTSKMKIANKSKDWKPKETSSIFANDGRSFVGDNNLVNLLPIVSSKELTEKKKNLHQGTSTSSAFSRRGNS